MSVDHLNADIASMMSDPAWFPHRYDAVDDKVHLIRADRAALRAATFLTDEFLSEASVPVVVGRTAAITQIDEIHSPHFIFHSAYCCSTLLANALDIERVSFALKEPTILNDISGWRRRGGQPAPVLEALKSALSLLSRPMSPGEQMIIKPSNVIDALAPALMAASPGSRRSPALHTVEELFGFDCQKGNVGSALGARIIRQTRQRRYDGLWLYARGNNAANRPADCCNRLAGATPAIRSYRRTVWSGAGKRCRARSCWPIPSKPWLL